MVESLISPPPPPSNGRPRFSTGARFSGDAMGHPEVRSLLCGLLMSDFWRFSSPALQNGQQIANGASAGRFCSLRGLRPRISIHVIWDAATVGANLPLVRALPDSDL